MTKQDERQRLCRRLQEYAIQIASANRWQEAIEINQQIILFGEDAITYNRLGKAYMEQGQYSEALEAYQQTLRLNPTNSIARKNVTKLEALQARGITQIDMEEHLPRKRIDLRMLITEAGKTTLTKLTEVQRTAEVEALSPAEQVELSFEDNFVVAKNLEGYLIGRLEPKLGQRLSDLMRGGNRYIGIVAQADPRKGEIRLLIRETYQSPNQRDRISFPGQLGEGLGLYHMPSLRYDYDTEEEELLDEGPMDDTEAFGADEEDTETELGLEDIEKDIADDDESLEE
ncbi:MAG: tetratricopeptide repeat protein [Chloroflexaceae bacterium]|nr:tetratricopeptide repeat protein [Chloroflexaceae bacterium]